MKVLIVSNFRSSASAPPRPPGPGQPRRADGASRPPPRPATGSAPRPAPLCALRAGGIAMRGARSGRRDPPGRSGAGTACAEGPPPGRGQRRPGKRFLRSKRGRGSGSPEPCPARQNGRRRRSPGTRGARNPRHSGRCPVHRHVWPRLPGLRCALTSDGAGARPVPVEPRAGGSGARQPRSGPSRAGTAAAARSTGPAPLPGGTRTAGSARRCRHRSARLACPPAAAPPPRTARGPGESPEASSASALGRFFLFVWGFAFLGGKKKSHADSVW